MIISNSIEGLQISNNVPLKIINQIPLVDTILNKFILFAIAVRLQYTPRTLVNSVNLCLTLDCGSGKHLRMRSYIFSNAHTLFSG